MSVTKWMSWEGGVDPAALLFGIIDDEKNPNLKTGEQK